MAPIVITEISHITNSLASSSQLETSASQLDGIPADLEDSIRYETTQLIQAAGILLCLPQEIIAQSIITLHRFWTGPDGGSLLDHDPLDTAAAAMYLVAKPSAHNLSPRQILTTWSYLSAARKQGQGLTTLAQRKAIPAWHLSPGEYERKRHTLYDIEGHILRVLGFQTQVALPHTLCINYMQTLEVFLDPLGPVVAKRAFAHLNTALLSPQLLYLTHQPSALATAAIYLAAREVGLKLPECEWWEVYDVDREELGFLVVALRSVEGFAAKMSEEQGKGEVPLTAESLKIEVERRRMLEARE